MKGRIGNAIVVVVLLGGHHVHPNKRRITKDEGGPVCWRDGVPINSQRVGNQRSSMMFSAAFSTGLSKRPCRNRWRRRVANVGQLVSIRSTQHRYEATACGPDPPTPVRPRRAFSILPSAKVDIRRYDAPRPVARVATNWPERVCAGLTSRSPLEPSAKCWVSLTRVPQIACAPGQGLFGNPRLC